MATISSTLRLIEQTTAPIQRTINSVDRLINIMEKANRTAEMPGLDAAMDEFRRDAGAAQNAVDLLNRELEETGRQSAAVDRVSGSFGGLSKAIVVANQGLQLMRQAWEGVSGLGNAADKRVSVDARLNLINDGERTQEQFESQVMAAANAARADYESTAALVATMGRQDIFAGNNDAAIAFSKTINEGLAVSGASASEANSVILQLSQGIASGVLRGDEFNSIMENGSVIAEMMAESLGVTKGELRDMAQDGQLTSGVVVSSIMQQADAIEEQFSSMPVTYGQAVNLMHNQASDLLNTLSQPGQAIDIIIGKIQDLNAWLNTAQGQTFLSGIAQGINLAITGIALLAQAVGGTYQFFADNWGIIEPILWGIGTAAGVLVLGFIAYKSVAAVTTAIEIAHAAATGISGAAQLVHAAATGTLTVAQWGLNASFLACPLTWIVIGIAAVVAAIVGLTLWVIHLWNTNIDFKVGVISIWNGIMGFFDQVPIFFTGIGYGIADGFSYAKVMVLQTLEDLVNGAIDRINRLIELANTIPGVSIKAIDHVEFAAQTAAEEEMARAERAANLAGKKAQAALKAAERERKLAEDENRWRAEAAAEEAAAKEQDKNQALEIPDYEFPPVELSGGNIDKVGKIGGDVDLSDQSLEYFHDIAEIQALDSASTYAAQYYDTGSTYMDYSQSIQNTEAHHIISNYASNEYLYGPQSTVQDAYNTSYQYESAANNTGGAQPYMTPQDTPSESLMEPEKASVLQSSAGQGNVYYLEYHGGVTINNDIKKGENWEAIKQRIYDEAESDLESGISDIEEVLYQ